MNTYVVTHPTANFTGAVTVKGFTMSFVSRTYTGPLPDHVLAELQRIGNYTVVLQSSSDTLTTSLLGLTITVGTAAPTTGTWNRGDIRYNSAPSAAGTPGWVCVAAGSPGVWKAMGNLAA